MYHAKCMGWKRVLPNSCDHSVQYTGLKISFKCMETSTLLHNFSSNLTAYPLGESTNKYNIFSLTSTSRNRSIFVCAGDVLSNDNLKPSSSWWISQGSKSKTWLRARWAPKHIQMPIYSLCPLPDPQVKCPSHVPFKYLLVLVFEPGDYVRHLNFISKKGRGFLILYCDGENCKCKYKRVNSY